MKSKILIAAFTGALLFASCEDDFLDTVPTEFISSDQIDEATKLNPGIQEGNIRGLYAGMLSTGTGGTTGHDDFGQKSWDIIMDMLSSDLVLSASNYGWYSSITELQATIDYTSNSNYMPWRYYYRIILGANKVIAGFGGADAVPDSEEGKHNLGQALALRAHSYFNLANLYAEEYEPSTPILPMYTTGEELENQPLSTAKEVYDLIISDLTHASSLLETFSRAHKNQINQWVAKGILAYAYGAVGNYEQMKSVTNDIIKNSGFPILGIEDVAREGTVSTNPKDEPIATGYQGFNDVSSPNWMWGADITLDNELDLVSWWGQMDLFTYSYSWAGDPKSIDDNLYAAIREDDQRKQWFQEYEYYSDGVLYPIGKFCPPGALVAGGQRSIETDYVFMRIEEMYLLHAEASAKTGDEPAAIESLKALLSNRIEDSGSYAYLDNLTGQALQNEIYLQTRIELWGEGKSYFAMKRNKATITRGANHLTYAGQSFEYNDDRLTLEIPQSEVQNNPNIN